MNYYILVLCVVVGIGIIYFTVGIVLGYKEIINKETYCMGFKRPRIVVSMTTIPSRLDNIHKVIFSLVNGSLPPDKIYLHIPEFSNKEHTFYNIPDNLYLFSTLKINIIPRDFGPLTKLLPIFSLETDPDTIIICVDDDKEYDVNLIDHLVRSSNIYPDACVCISGWNYLNLKLLALPFFSCPTGIVSRVKILQCYNGVLYKRSFFEDDVYELPNYKECFTTDDIAISKYLSKRNIPIYAVPYTHKNKNINNKNTSTLGSFNLMNNQWIKCINA